ncbi:MAG: hypothetical protein ABSA83_12415 [Verrucomicrobiota bacterium]
MELPGSAKVYVEAYHKSDWMRFDFGTVAAPAIPSDRRLTAFYDGARILFRVKVVSTGDDSGKILAETDRLTPLAPDNDRDHDPLLNVRVVGNLGHQVWRVTWNGGPVLELNKNEPECKHLLTTDSRFKWLILPEVLRTILTRVLTEEMDEDDEAGDGGPGKRWLEYAVSVHPEPPPNPDARDPEIIEKWVDEVVASFCRRHRAFDHWRAAIHPNDELFSSQP